MDPDPDRPRADWDDLDDCWRFQAGDSWRMDGKGVGGGKADFRPDMRVELWDDEPSPLPRWEQLIEVALGSVRGALKWMPEDMNTKQDMDQVVAKWAQGLETLQSQRDSFAQTLEQSPQRQVSSRSASLPPGPPAESEPNETAEEPEPPERQVVSSRSSMPLGSPAESEPDETAEDEPTAADIGATAEGRAVRKAGRDARPGEPDVEAAGNQFKTMAASQEAGKAEVAQATGDAEEAEIAEEAAGVEAPDTPSLLPQHEKGCSDDSVPHVLMCHDQADQAERARAIGQARIQGFKPPIKKMEPLPLDWAIAHCPGGGGRRGKEFALRCVLARSRCISEGGRVDDVIIYKLKRATRALLSPKGVEAFRYVAEHVSREALAELQKSSPSKRAPKSLLQTLRDAGLKISLDSGLAIPDLKCHPSNTVEMWWQMHKAGVKAMEPKAGSKELEEWKANCKHFAEAMQAESEAEDQEDSAQAD